MTFQIWIKIMFILLQNIFTVSPWLIYNNLLYCLPMWIIFQFCFKFWNKTANMYNMNKTQLQIYNIKHERFQYICDIWIMLFDSSYIYFFISICSLFIIKPLYFVDAQLCPIFTLYSCVKKKHKIRSKNIVLQEILDSWYVS